MIQKIVSGGQTGVDRAGLDVALFLQIDHGGWCPRGRRAEDGCIPNKYNLVETESRNYQDRTEQNVIDSCGTLILFWNSMQGGTKLTAGMARKHKRLCLEIDLSDEPDIEQVQTWLKENQIQTLNIAGPRETSSPGISDLAREFLLQVLRD